ncbi:MAG: hypothetical protein IV086_07425 [Hyphomonadaceae bacterium]|nr:MAG: hypothetical protein FD160_1862 [Caulobacteraceae bacterium]MBT9445510.1 hypothetical protein [Hyphomonadaceae bacterium]
MKIFKKAFWAALMAGSALTGATGAANAETTVSGNVALTSDYAFRGISQTDQDPALQGGFDMASGIFYAGTWASSIDFAAQSAELELDVYAGVTPTVGPVTFDLGVVGYLYPSASDDASELDFWELKGGAKISPAEGFTIGGTLFYSPEFTLDGGDSLYAEGAASYALTDKFSLSGAVGHQSVDAAAYFADGATFTDSYTTWNLGATYAIAGFGLDLRYVDTDLDTTITEERVILSIKRAL